MCYEAAERSGTPTRQALISCDDALKGMNPLSDEEIVATHVNRGIVRMRRGDLEGAVADYERARSLDPNEPEVYLNHATLLLRREQAAPALDYFNQAIQKRTRRPALAYFGRAIANETLGNVRAAYMDYRRASELDPEWGDPLRELSRFRVQPSRS